MLPLPVPSVLAGLAFLAATSLVGVAATRRAAPFLDPLERIAYGAPLGMVVASLVLLFLAGGLGLRPWLVILVGVACLTLAVVPAVGRPPRLPDPRGKRRRGAWLDPQGRWRLPALVLGGFVARFVLLAGSALILTSDGLWAGHAHFWGDWALHLGDVTSFAYGDNFPPRHPRLAGHAYGYHYLASVTTAALTVLGLDPVAALAIHSLALWTLVVLGVFTFGRRLAGDAAVATLALVLFLLGGGLGWWMTLEQAIEAGGPATLIEQPWDRVAQERANFRWLNVVFALLAPQRGYLYGLPLSLLALTALFAGVTGGGLRPFLVAGVVAGLSPFAHLGSLLALALIAPALALSFPIRGWVAFVGVWIALAAPQLFVLLDGGSGLLAAWRLQVGWIAAPDPWLWFWLKNLGVFLPLLGWALVRSDLVPAPSRRFLWAFMPLFAVANLVVFQPWDWDNTKVLVYWYLAGSVLVAAALVRAWRARPRPGARLLVAGAVLSLVLSGVLEHLHQAIGRDRHRLLTAEEVALAHEVRARTPAGAVFAVGLQPGHPVPVLAGRRVLMGYPGWLWSHGLATSGREREVRAIFALEPEAPALLARHRVDYVVVGPWEREHLGADAAEWTRRYPEVLRSERYRVFAVGRPREP